jgi:uncharacterized protein (TIGR03437 family)
MVVGPAQLTLSNYSSSSAPMTLTYTKYQNTLVSGNVTVYGPTVYFGVDTTTLPSWLTVNFTSGEATPSSGGSGGFPLTFTVTKVADSMTPNTYGPIAINLKVAGYASTPVYITLVDENTAPTLSAAEGTVRNLSWSVGQALPTATITAVSSGTPIPYTTTISAGSQDAGASVNPSAGLAYSFGTPIAVTFNPLDFAGAQPGSTLTTTVTLHWTLGAAAQTIPVAFSISIEAPSTTAALTGISPSNLPSASAGEAFTVTLYGSGFVSSTDPTQKTTVGILSSGALHADANIVSNVVSASTIILTITVPPGTSDPLMSFASTNTLVLGVCNPAGSIPGCSAATGTQSLIIDAGPIIQTNGVTSASTFSPVSCPANGSCTGALAPYDIISIFGSNFCTSGGSGCTGVLYPTVSAAGVYGTTVTPDAGQRSLQVWFYPTGTTNNGWAAPLLFATNNQINAVVPGEITASTPTKYDIVVKFGTLSSAAYTFISATTDPGVFVVDGNNNGAIVLPSGLVTNSQTNAASLRVSQANSDIVSIFMTGLGTPLSTGSNATQSGTSIPWTDCIAPTGSNSYAGAAGLSTLDGATILSSLVTTGMLVPCFNQSSYLTVTVGGQAATPKYVGWAPNAIDGLYQVNVLLPAYGAGLQSTAASPVTLSQTSGALQVPVVVTITTPGTRSQANVGMWVQPAQTVLLAGATNTGVTDLSSGVYSVSAAALASGAPTFALDSINVTGGTSPTFAVTSVTGTSAVTSDFAVDSSGNVTIATAYAAGGSYSVTITVTDTGIPALPSATITLYVTMTT